jgi:hypothetical protein
MSGTGLNSPREQSGSGATGAADGSLRADFEDTVGRDLTETAMSAEKKILFNSAKRIQTLIQNSTPGVAEYAPPQRLGSGST